MHRPAAAPEQKQPAPSENPFSALAAQTPTPQRFSQFFAAASERYYRRAHIGDDFITAVSCGPLFGATIAAAARKICAERWGGARVPLLEFGAAAGHLMGDLIAAAPGEFDFFISEPKPELQERQRQLLGSKFRHASEDFCAPRALIVANELLDALPCELVLGGRLMGVASGRLVPMQPLDSALLRELLPARVGDFLYGAPLDATAPETPTPETAAATAGENLLFSQNPAKIPTPETAAATAGENLLFSQNPAKIPAPETAAATAGENLLFSQNPAKTPTPSENPLFSQNPFLIQGGELATGAAAFLAALCQRFEHFCLLAFDYACAHADAPSARVFYAHRAPLDIREADLAALAEGAADITYTPAIDQLQAICAALGLRCKITRQAAWLIEHGAAEIAAQTGDLAALKRLCFGFGESFFAFEISR